MTDLTPEPTARPAPDWLPTGDVEDVVIGSLKTGKEAEVFVVERRSLDDDRTCLLAHKRYRPLTASKGELEEKGFSKARTFVDDTVYHEGKRFRRTRDKRAVAKMTTHGKKLLGERWVGHELDTMRTLWDAGASVPYPVELHGDGMLMELIGDETQAAPRLVNARLSPADLELAWDQLVENLGIMVGASIVHGDLSPYNALWWDGALWIIDLPQASDLLLNPHGFELLHRDVTQMCAWFTRMGRPCDAEALFAELLAAAW